VWRIIIALSLIPAFGTLYQRLTLPESTRYKKDLAAKQAQLDAEAGDEIAKLKAAQRAEEIRMQKAEKTTKEDATGADIEVEKVSERASTEEGDDVPLEFFVKKKAHFGGVCFLFVPSCKRDGMLMGIRVCAHRVRGVLLGVAPLQAAARDVHVLVPARHRVRLLSSSPPPLCHGTVLY
jgi:hypothetical protein